jgi:hypothetical protein
MTGGCLDDDDWIDNICEKSVYKDFWSYDINNKNWKCISNNIFGEFNNEFCDYMELSHNENENIFFIGKFIGNIIFIYNIQNNSFRQVKFELKTLFQMEYYVQKFIILNSNIFLIVKNEKHISVLKLNLNSSIFEIYKLCDNIYGDVLLSCNNENIFFIERKLESDFVMLRYDNNLFDIIINKINNNKNKFTNEDYKILPNSLKKKLNINL